MNSTPEKNTLYVLTLQGILFLKGNRRILFQEFLGKNDSSSNQNSQK